MTFHRNGVATVPSPGDPDFDDSDPNRYWSSLNPWASTKVAGSGTTMTVSKTTDAQRAAGQGQVQVT